MAGSQGLLIHPFKHRKQTMKKLFNFANFTFGTVLVYIGLIQSDSGYLWNACLIVGGVYIGHVITDVLNTHTEQSE